MEKASSKRLIYQPDSYVSIRKRLRQMLQRINPQDIISTRLHSRDFTNSRAEYVSIRIRILSIAFAVLAPLWIPIDYFSMEEPAFSDFLVLRLLFAAMFLVLGLWGTQCNRIQIARFRLLAFVIIPGLFYLSSSQLLSGVDGFKGILHGYTFLPLLIMALIAIAPLTLLESLSYSSIIVGFFLAASWIQGTLISASTIEGLWLLLLLGTIATWIQMSQLHMLMRLYREATRDALTGLVNRRVLTAKLDQEVKLREQNNSELSLLIFDLDLFKRINDTYGHHAGDVVLQAFADILREHSRPQHMVGRYGGEEFLAILPDCTLAEATELAEEIRQACHHYTVYIEEDNYEIEFTTSIGVAHWRGEESAEVLVKRVDQGLYQAKAAGRDMVVVAE
jgi:diguanylate cyclase (GGDEF)-like protein